MNQTVRVAATLAVLGALATAASACGATRDGAGGGQPTAVPDVTSPADESGEATYDFPRIKSMVDRSGEATFTAEYDVTAPTGATSATLVRQSPVTALQLEQVRMIWTADDTYVCQGTGAAQQCYRRGAPSENEDPATGPGRDWAATLADAGLEMLSPVGAWRNLEGFRRDGVTVVESSDTIAGQVSSCVELTSEAAVVDWTGTMTACFLDKGQVARYFIELTSGGQSELVTVELTGYSSTVDAQAVEVPTDAPIQG